MPTYDYVCSACGHALEIFHSMTEAAKKKCPACGKAKLERKIGAGAGFLFKGAGFYKTDYRSESYKAGEKAEKQPAASESSTPAPSDKSNATTADASTSKENKVSENKSEAPSSPSADRSGRSDSKSSKSIHSKPTSSSARSPGGTKSKKKRSD